MMSLLVFLDMHDSLYNYHYRPLECALYVVFVQFFFVRKSGLKTRPLRLYTFGKT